MDRREQVGQNWLFQWCQDIIYGKRDDDESDEDDTSDDNAPPDGAVAGGEDGAHHDADAEVLAVEAQFDELNDRHLRLAAELERHVAGVPKVISKIILDDLAFVTEAQNEIAMPVVGVGFHNVPKNRPIADGHHRFGTILRLLAQPRALTAA